MQLLGVLQNLKGITSDQIASQCVLQSYASGNVQLFNKTDAQMLTQFSAHFLSTTDEGCNFAAYVPSEEGTPLQVNNDYFFNAPFEILQHSNTLILCLKRLCPEG